MNKKQISVILTTVIFFNATAMIYADKKDVSDPVLREIITELNTKMPRFINKYGATVFVADEQITRGSLISALYEYDKKTSAVGVDGIVSKKDFDLLNTRLTALEKNVSLAKTGTSKTAATHVDIIQVMNDLGPNMPMMLDNSLAESKVFKELKKQVEMGAGATASATSVSSVAPSKEVSVALSNLQKDVQNLNNKVDSFELSLVSAKSGSSKLTDTQVSASITNMQKELINVNNKINSFETKLLSSKNTADSPTAYDQEFNELKRSLVQMQKSYVNVAKRVDSLETKPNVYASASGVSYSQFKDLNEKIDTIKETVADVPTSDYVHTQISKINNETSSDIKRIENRLNSLEKSDKVSTDGSSKSSGTSTVAKISLGITMVAALFIAR